MSLADYLAKNYLTADAPSHKSGKKRKRKEAAGLVIADDDISGWQKSQNREQDDDAPTVVSSRSGEFRKARSSNWTAVGASTATANASTNAEEDTADAIIASAAAEQAAMRAANNDDEAPQIVDDANADVDEEGDAVMESGAVAGLQTAEQVSAAVERRKAKERRRDAAKGDDATGKGQETVYRDASGRIINIAMKRAEARKKADEEARKQAEEKEAARGDVQRAEREQRKQDLADAKYMSVARYADDADMNEELKERERWNDPAARFLTKKKEGRSTTGKPLYKGAAAPNRYNIRPGHRWDGVDRSNGFEKEYFAAQNRRQNMRDLSYQWEMDE